MGEVLYEMHARVILAGCYFDAGDLETCPDPSAPIPFNPDHHFRMDWGWITIDEVNTDVRIGKYRR